jgi:hypothetical protein
VRKFFAVLAFVIFAVILVLRSVGLDEVMSWFYPNPAPVPGRLYTWLREDFDSNQNHWELREEATRRNAIVNGRYIFHNKGEEVYQWVHIPVDSLSDFRDFTIEAEIVKKSGRNNNTYGIIWGFDDDFRRYEFGITGDGSYRISRCINNNWEYLVDYTESDALRTPNESNTLTVSKRGFEMIFSINRQPVDTLSYQPLFGKGVGFGVHSDISIEIESLRVSSP